jgi:hypothetical protein
VSEGYDTLLKMPRSTSIIHQNKETQLPVQQPIPNSGSKEPWSVYSNNWYDNTMAFFNEWKP